MHKNKILEGILGNLIVALTETHRTTGKKQEVHVLLSDTLRDLLTPPRCSWKPAKE